MRARKWLAGGVLGLALATPVFAQHGAPSTFFGGVDPRDIVYKPVDTSNVIAPVSTPSRISFRGILAKFGIPGMQAPPTPLPGPGSSGPRTIKSPFQPVQPIGRP